LPAEQGSEWHLDADPLDERSTLMRNGTLHLHPLPVLLFANGHVAFVQRLPWKCVQWRGRGGEMGRTVVL
jgi:hypothetical protein